MAKSRFAAALLLLSWQSAAAAADPLSAEQALANYHRRFVPVAQLRCPKAADPEEIVVCGHPEGADPNRVPFPEQREPGERVHLIPGEPPSAVAALDGASRSPCEMAGPNHSCGGGFDFIQILFGAIKVIKAAHDRHSE